MFEHSRKRLFAEERLKVRCVVPKSIVTHTINELRSRSEGWRESAAIWVGDKQGNVEQVLFHHKLDDDKSGPLSLELPERAKYRLYQELAQKQQSLIALLHTHPQDWVGLSLVDQQNQLSSKTGFLSIVVPYYARENWDSNHIGFHCRTDDGWYQLDKNDVNQCFAIEG